MQSWGHESESVIRALQRLPAAARLRALRYCLRRFDIDWMDF